MKEWKIKKRKVEPQIFFSLKCFDRFNPKKFSRLKYCVIYDMKKLWKQYMKVKLDAV